ncbi:MAG: hypothetical protein ACLP5H_31995 [Desulfomonilaceae bacterium]
MGKWLHGIEAASFPQIDKAEVFGHHADATTGKPQSPNGERGYAMTDSALEVRVQELEKQIADLQQQVAALTKMVERIVKPANKVVNGIMSSISAVKEHLKGSDNP